MIEHEDTLRAIDDAAYRLWELGRNAVVGWRPHPAGIALVVERDYVLLDRADSHTRLVHGRRRMGPRTFAEVAALLEVSPSVVPLAPSDRGPVGALPWPAVECIVARSAISQTRHRGVVLLDIRRLLALDPARADGADQLAGEFRQHRARA